MSKKREGHSLMGFRYEGIWPERVIEVAPKGGTSRIQKISTLNNKIKCRPSLSNSYCKRRSLIRKFGGESYVLAAVTDPHRRMKASQVGKLQASVDAEIRKQRKSAAEKHANKLRSIGVNARVVEWKHQYGIYVKPRDDSKYASKTYPGMPLWNKGKRLQLDSLKWDREKFDRDWNRLQNRSGSTPFSPVAVFNRDEEDAIKDAFDRAFDEQWGFKKNQPDPAIGEFSMIPVNSVKICKTDESGIDTCESFVGGEIVAAAFDVAFGGDALPSDLEIKESLAPQLLAEKFSPESTNIDKAIGLADAFEQALGKADGIMQQWSVCYCNKPDNGQCVCNIVTPGGDYIPFQEIVNDILFNLSENAHLIGDQPSNPTGLSTSELQDLCLGGDCGKELTADSMFDLAKITERIMEKREEDMFGERTGQRPGLLSQTPVTGNLPIVTAKQLVDETLDKGVKLHVQNRPTGVGLCLGCQGDGCSICMDFSGYELSWYEAERAASLDLAEKLGLDLGPQKNRMLPETIQRKIDEHLAANNMLTDPGPRLGTEYKLGIFDRPIGGYLPRGNEPADMVGSIIDGRTQKLGDVAALRAALNEAGFTATPTQLLDRFEDAFYAVRIRPATQDQEGYDLPKPALGRPQTQIPEISERWAFAEEGASLTTEPEIDMEELYEQLVEEGIYSGDEDWQTLDEFDLRQYAPEEDVPISPTRTLAGDGNASDLSWYNNKRDALIEARYIGRGLQEDSMRYGWPAIVEVIRAPMAVPESGMQGGPDWDRAVKYGELTNDRGILKWEVFLENLVEGEGIDSSMGDARRIGRGWLGEG